MSEQPNRRWFRFRLRTLLVVVTVVAGGLAWLTHERRKIAHRREAIQALGVGPIGIGHQAEWRVRLLGDDWPKYALGIEASGARITDAALANFEELTQLENLHLENTQVTDAGLIHLKGLTQLLGLGLYHAQVTDAGLRHLKELTQLQGLSLSRNRITDVGLVHLKGLMRLNTLSLDGTQITDSGLVHLKALTKLYEVDLSGTRVTAAGVAELQKALPSCKIIH